MISSTRQLVSRKKLNQFESILGKRVIAGFMNGDLPHNIALAWTTQCDAYLINIKKKTFHKSVDSGKVLLRKVLAFRKMTPEEYAEYNWVKQANKLIDEINEGSTRTPGVLYNPADTSGAGWDVT